MALCIYRMSMMNSDATLIRHVLAGNDDAFGSLVTRYQAGVYALVWSKVRDFAAAEDITQEAFIIAYTQLPRLRDPARFASWLRRVAANTARMWLRKRSGREAKSDMDQAVAPDNTGGGGLRNEIAEALASLPQQKREVAILCYLDGVSRKEAARFLGVPDATMRKRLHDAKRLLQKRIVEAAEKNLEEHLLPRGFASRCICACERALDEKRKEMMAMANEKKNCGCGCWVSGETKPKSKGTNESRARSRPKVKTRKTTKAGRRSR